MPTAIDTPGAVFKRGTVCLLARIVDAENQPIVMADVDTLVYSVLEIDPSNEDAWQALAGHDDVSLDPVDVLTDTLDVSDLWTVDAVGHNFRHVIDISSDEAFPKAGVDYLVRYELTPVDGQRIVFRFRLRSV